MRGHRGTILEGRLTATRDDAARLRGQAAARLSRAAKAAAAVQRSGKRRGPIPAATRRCPACEQDRPTSHFRSTHGRCVGCAALRPQKGGDRRSSHFLRRAEIARGGGADLLRADVRLRMQRIAPSAADVAVWQEAAGRWGLSGPSLCDVLEAHYGRVPAGVESVVSLIAMVGL